MRVEDHSLELPEGHPPLLPINTTLEEEDATSGYFESQLQLFDSETAMRSQNESEKCGLAYEIRLGRSPKLTLNSRPFCISLNWKKKWSRADRTADLGGNELIVRSPPKVLVDTAPGHSVYTTKVLVGN